MMGGGKRWVPVEAEYEEKIALKRQFDDLLKNSDFFRDVIQSVREGTGAAIGAVLAEMLRDEPVAALKVLNGLRNNDNNRTILFNEGPSGRGSMELVLRAVADRLQIEMANRK